MLHDPRKKMRPAACRERDKKRSGWMPVNYVDFQTAKDADGLRMVVVTGVPSPWGEAAKGILHVKQIPWLAVKLDQANSALTEWSGERTGPVAVYNDEKPRAGWAEILLLAERLSPTPALLPADAAERALVLGLSHEICGEGGLGWMRRLQGVHAGLNGQPGFPAGIAEYLGNKYGYRAEEGDAIQGRVIGLLNMLSSRLDAQKQEGNRFLVGSSLTAADIYFAAFIALFKPLPPDQCPLPDAMRPGFEAMDDDTAKALDSSLLEHRDFIYNEYLELPLTL
jgi:glutathione S-transferase